MAREDDLILAAIRTDVLRGFSGEVYKHVLDEPVSGIDNLGILSLLAGASHKARDYEIEDLCVKWINTCLSIHEDCRNFDVVPHDGWKYNGQYYWKRKPQASAGPFSLEWARKVGCNVPSVWNVDMSACLFSLVPSWLIKLKPFRQHLNTVMLAHLVLGEKPGSSWHWASKYNPFYSYIRGIPCPVQYRQIYKTVESVETDYIVPMANRVGSQWVWKQWPYTASVSRSHKQYTPAALLVAYYLQQSL